MGGCDTLIPPTSTPTPAVEREPSPEKEKKKNIVFPNRVEQGLHKKIRGYPVRGSKQRRKRLLK